MASRHPNKPARPGLRRPTPTLAARAVALLARREYTRAELRERLLAAGERSDRSGSGSGDDGCRGDGGRDVGAGEAVGAVDAVDAVLDDLERRGFLSDRRYAEAVTRQKAGTHGRQAIAAVLRAKGVDADVAAEAVARLAADDDATLVAVWRRRFGRPPADDRERARQVRFLQSRGFALSAILRFLRTPPVDPSDGENSQNL